MTKELWINLPSKDVARSRDFYRSMEFTFNPNFPGGDEAGISLLVGAPPIVVNLFPEAAFSGFVAGAAVTDARESAEVLLSIGAESRQEVDAIAGRVAAAGGVLYAAPGESQGWLYACGFADPDGHRWNVLFMDMGNMPQG